MRNIARPPSLKKLFHMQHISGVLVANCNREMLAQLVAAAARNAAPCSGAAVGAAPLLAAAVAKRFASVFSHVEMAPKGEVAGI
jgi:hypothetical protein